MDNVAGKSGEGSAVHGAPGNSSRFFRNEQCEYFPCHDTGTDGFNCLFCYCPMYYGYCPGTHEYVQAGGALIKDCSGCDYPHRPENYEAIVEYLKELLVSGPA